ncbi:MAG: 4Fe-4S binding protein, partial [Pseudomonadota bacterium]
APVAGLKTGETYTHLCRTQLNAFQTIVAQGAPLMVACTQEAPLFSELADEVEEATGKSVDIAYTNIRERAGWSAEADKKNARTITAKMAALIAEATLEVTPATTVSATSEGTALIYGTDERALEAADKLKDRLDVTVLLSRPQEIVPPRIGDVPIFRGTIVGAKGHFGGFEIIVNDYAPSAASSRDQLRFEPSKDGAASQCDLILDLTGGSPMFTGHGKRDGYFRPDPDSPAAVAEALFEMADLVGEFEKPRYVNYREDLCAHSRSRKSGCTRCIDVCPAGAITSAGDHVEIDPIICGGCGGCASVCPTGAATYALPAVEDVFERLRVVLNSYHTAGGKDAAILIHDTRSGEDILSMMARFGRGLPARVIPFAVNEVTQIGFDFLSAAFAYGASDVRILIPQTRRDELSGLAMQIGLTEAALGGLGYGSGRVGVIDETDPTSVEEFLYSLPHASGPEAGRFLPMGGKRSRTMLALRHLHDVAPAPVDVLPLSEGAPFGAVNVDADGCTLCMSCVGACPTGALLDNEDRPELSFNEEACVQCGLCKVTCPENVISLTPQLNFTNEARSAQIVSADNPFHCVRCGKPFGSEKTVMKIVDTLAQKHTMFQGADAAARLMMCEDCRVVVQMEKDDNPFAGKPRPLPRTTEDDLRERERAKAQNMFAASQKDGAPTKH